ncbi:hypothetical protein ACFODQ_00150, partial [Comamonas sp. JC664]
MTHNAPCSAQRSARRCLMKRRSAICAWRCIAHVRLAHQLSLAARFVASRRWICPSPMDGCLMFYTITAQNLPITSFSIQQPSVAEAWTEGAARMRQWAWAFNATGVELRIDWATAVLPLPGDEPQDALADLRQSWSLADSAQERAEMLALLSHRMTRALAPPAAAERSSARQHPGPGNCCSKGLHISPLGEDAHPSRHDPLSPRSSHGSAASAIYQATQELLARSQSEDGKLARCHTLVDHLGITYALLLTQRQSAPNAKLVDDRAPCHRLPGRADAAL